MNNTIINQLLNGNHKYLCFYNKYRKTYGYIIIDLNNKEYQCFGSNTLFKNCIELKYNESYRIIDNLKENGFIEKQ